MRMKLSLIIEVAILCCCLTLAVITFGKENSQCDIGKWIEFKAKYNKSYRNSVEHDERREIFCQRLALMNDYNIRVGSLKLAVNHMADWTAEERRRLTMR